MMPAGRIRVQNEVTNAQIKSTVVIDAVNKLAQAIVGKERDAKDMIAKAVGR